MIKSFPGMIGNGFGVDPSIGAWRASIHAGLGMAYA
jgi:hypothetical protein